MDTDEKHSQLMSFMAAFKKSIENIEDNIKDTNKKLDRKLEHIDKEIVGIKEKMDDNQKNAEGVQGRMDARLNMLENEMKNFNKKCEKTEGGRRLEKETIPADKKADEEMRNSDQTAGRRRLEMERNPAKKTDDETSKVRKNRVKKFTKNVITQDDLVNDLGMEVVDIIETDPLNTEPTPYHSTWAQDVEEEYGGMEEQAALRNGRQTGLERKQRQTMGDTGKN